MRNPIAAPRHSRTILSFALAASGLLAGGALMAAPPAMAPHAQLLEKADTNGDNAVSAEEFDAMRAAHLARLDGDNDGFVTFEEHKASREARARERFLSRHDADGDGRISVDEMAGRGEDHFQRMDRNGDGSITTDELRHRPRAGEHMRRGHRAGTDAGR